MLMSVPLLLALAADATVRCNVCGQVLTSEEVEYYEYRCEACEVDWSDRLHRYMDGANDPLLDLMLDP